MPGRFLTALTLLACVAAGACASARLELRTLQQDEREVLRAVIRHMQADKDEPEREPAIVDGSMEIMRDYHLFPDAEALREEAQMSDVEFRFPLEVFPDVIRRNQRRASLAQLVGEATGARWVSQLQMDSLDAAERRELNATRRLLAQMHPGARSVNQLSRPGFDEPRRYAAVAYGYSCGDLCGAAGVYLMERRDGRWRVITRIPMIVS